MMRTIMLNSTILSILLYDFHFVYVQIVLSTMSNIAKLFPQMLIIFFRRFHIFWNFNSSLMKHCSKFHSTVFILQFVKLILQTSFPYTIIILYFLYNFWTFHSARLIFVCLRNGWELYNKYRINLRSAMRNNKGVSYSAITNYIQTIHNRISF